MLSPRGFPSAWIVPVVCLCACSAPATSDAPATVVKSPIGTRIDSYLTNLSEFGYSGVMLVLKDGGVILRKGYGMADEARGIPNTPATVFDIGSLAKTFTAAAVLTLEQQGKLKVTDRMAQYLPGVPDDKQGITLEQLLTHSSGMDRDFPLANPNGPYYEDVGRDEAVQRILALPLIAPPGQEYSYSNCGYVLLAAIVERVSGVPFRDYLRSSLFEPAGMKDTGFWGSGLPQVSDSLIAHCYDETGETGDPHDWSPTTWVDLGGGEIVSTVEDLSRWATALTSNRVLPAAVMQKVFTPHQGDYGYGWWIRETPRGTTLIEHGGDYFGFGSQISWFRDENVVMVHLANRSNQLFGTRHIAERITTQIIFGDTEYHMFKGDTFELPPACKAVTPEAARRFAGTYRLPTGGTLVIYPDGDGLQIGAIGQDAVDAIAAAPDSTRERRARISSMTARMMNGMAAGDTTAFTAEILRPGGPLHAYRQGIMQTLDEVRTEHGPLKSVDVEGTMPGIYPVGVMHTKVRMTCEQGSDAFDFVFLNDRVIGMTPAPQYLAATPLKQAPNGGLAGWSIIWFRGFEVALESPAADANGGTLTIRHKDRTFQAKRVSP